MLGGIKDIPAIIKRRDIGVILSAAPAAARETTEYIFDLCQKNNIRLIFLKDLWSMLDQQINKQVGTYEYPVWLEERLALKTIYDGITGLPNRYLFHDRINHSVAYARVYKSRLAVMFIRVEKNNLDSVEHGRKVDDQILIEVAARLAKCCRESDTLAYIGNSTFAMILENVMEEEIPDSVAKRILAILSEPIKIDHSDFQIQANINIKVSEDSEQLDEMKTFCQAEIENLHEIKNNTEALNQHDITLGK
jgi:diguanylate cyclase (GGDEF)-like protein